MSSLSNHINVAAAEVGVHIYINALATAACALEPQLASVDGECRVGLDASSALGLFIGGVVGTVASGKHSGATAVDDNVALAVYALGSLGRHLNIDNASIDEYAVVGLDAVIGCRVGINVVALAKHDVVGRVDGVVGVAGNAQLSAAVEQQLALAVEGSLLTASSAVSKGVGGAIGQYDVGTFATKQIKCSRVWIGYAGSVELNLVFFVAKNCKRTVAGGAANHVTDVLSRAVVGCDVAAVNGYLYSVLGLGYRGAHVYAYLSSKAVVLECVFLVGEVLAGGA